MSKVKTPKEKKRLSLDRDRRNVYGENAKSSRKNIPRGKQLRHMDERRSVGAALQGLRGPVPDEHSATEAETAVADAVFESRRRGFKKWPDQPLGEVLQHRKEQKRGSKWSHLKSSSD